LGELVRALAVNGAAKWDAIVLETRTSGL